MTKDRIDDVLARHYARKDATDEAALRVLARLHTLPAQKEQRWRLPGVLLDWQFAPAWPRIAALACCALIGFAVGAVGVDRFVQPQTQDLAAVFEPEPLTGLRP
jgi:hypothetical protein